TSGTRSRSMPAASSEANRPPVVATMTGSRITLGGRRRRSHSPTACTRAASPSMPILTASISTSSATASSWAITVSSGTGWTSDTPTVFWTVTAVTTPMPYPPIAATALTSASSPAPPDGSVPAMHRMRGTRTPSAAGSTSSATERRPHGLLRGFHGGRAPGGRLVLGARPVVRPERERVGQRLAAVTELRPGVDVEQSHVLEQVTAARPQCGLHGRRGHVGVHDECDVLVDRRVRGDRRGRQHL